MGIRTIAEKANVSIATVSRVMNSPKLVKENTRKKVLKIIREFDYQKYNYQFNIENSSDEVGVIIPDVKNSYFARILEGITKKAQELDFPISLYLTHDDNIEEYNAITRLIKRKARGVILIRTKNESKDTLKGINKLNRYKIPFVLVDRDLKDNDYSGVFLSSANAVYDSITMLIKKGFVKIAIISGRSDNLNSIQRISGYKEALIDNDMPVNEKYIFNGDYSAQNSLEIVRKILSSNDIPEVIFACANQISMGCIQAVQEKKLILGKDIKIFSFNKLDASSIDNFDISYVEHPVEHMGERSVSILKSKFVGTKGLIREIMDYKINY
ncbi:MAG: LacI family transcriptional regulator [Epsilonproteobacteria bacterium]|nr:LacI family transcriptional regulator [Campylobacterota bacterium]